MADVAPRGRLVLDTGGLLALAEHDRQARALIERAATQRMQIVVPTVVLTQCIRGGPRDAPINRFLRVRCDILPVTEVLTRQAGILLALLTGSNAPARAEQPDAVDAIVAAFALQHFPAAILTSDPTHIRRLLESTAERGRVQVIAV
jgi:predicted nucleic acid-binding protein